MPSDMRYLRKVQEATMEITRVEDGAIVMSDEDMTGRRLYSSPGAVVIHMTINPGRAIMPHSASMDMEFFVLEGEAVFTVGEEEAVARAGALVAGPKDISHGIRNPGHVPLKILAIKNP